MTLIDGDRIYLFNKLNVLVTPLVRTHLETDNTRIALVKDGRLIGIGPGKTNVRVRREWLVGVVNGIDDLDLLLCQ